MAKNRKRVEGASLYSYSTCPFCMTVRFAIRQLGLEIPIRDIISQPRHRIDLIAGGGKSQVPCLRVENDAGDIRWIYESVEIIRYLKTELVE